MVQNMTTPVGFILVTYNKPHQIVRLVNTLNRIFDYPPIVCHHDYSQSALPPESLPKNVVLVRPHVVTRWGSMTVIEATLRALDLMYRTSASPDWFVFLSAADYPIKPAQRILHDLASSPYDAHIHYERIAYNAYERDWQRLCYERYCSIRLPFPCLNRNLRLTRREVILKHPLVTAPFLPFSKSLRCFAGEHWFCANRQAAEYLLEFHHTKPALASYFRRLERYTIIPEESYYQTVFCNVPCLKVSNRNWRYTDWSQGGRSPKTLLSEDLPKILASSAHFARKFDIDVDSSTLDTLDAVIG